MPRSVDQVLPWVVRALWAVLPLTAGPALGALLDPWSPTPRLLATLLLWGGWLAGLVATLVPHPLGLTAIRLAAPVGVVATAWAAATVDGDRLSSAVAALAVASTGAAAIAVFTTWTTELFVNGPAYPNERRLPLRVPGPLLLGPLPLAWALTSAGVVAGPLLLADGRIVPGAVATAIGLPLAVLLGRALHGLSRRWVVFVPAGLVLHDPMALMDPVLFRREVVEVLQPAAADTDSLDLTRGALGLALELVLLEKVPMTLLKPGSRTGEPGSSARLLFTPTRPGEVLAEAASRRIATG